ncbi:MAG: DNA polymerase III subunit gamma/tau [Burkholderiaceae bacterium]
MSHQVLARKWRPRDFGSLVGQEHVVRALTHALDSDRLHHAYLFTGTRGVGKTTLARILAKAVNCETGVGASPCGQCRSCREIDEGRFVDYLELDAASNRGVDEMVQLLENAVYAPSAGRYKVYVIDEVHMLSTHAFNAMLKTLEEPPPHVLFILATTDPQKVPVTVLSRCMQFNLRNMPAGAISAHLETVLQAEQVPFESAALAMIGRSASGSMRDALSLLDQAIAFGGGRVEAGSVAEMLGHVDQNHVARVLECLVAGDGPGLIALADALAGENLPFERLLADLATVLQRIALGGVAPLQASDDPASSIAADFVGRIPAEDLQAYYQISIHGRRDLGLAPDPRTGFTMTLLRLLAFRCDLASTTPADGAARPKAKAPGAGGGPSRGDGGGIGGDGGLRQPRPAALVRAALARSASVPASTHRADPIRADALEGAAAAARGSDADPTTASPAAGAAVEFDGDWPALARRLPLGGLAAQFMRQSELLGFADDVFRLRVPIRPLAEPGLVAKIRDVLVGALRRQGPGRSGGWRRRGRHGCCHCAGAATGRYGGGAALARGGSLRANTDRRFQCRHRPGVRKAIAGRGHYRRNECLRGNWPG